MEKLRIVLISCLLVALNCNATSLTGRLGLGMSSIVPSGMKTLSLKLQRNSSTALGGIFGLDSSPDASLYAVGLKLYRIIYDEPQLNFYSAFGASMFTYQNNSQDVEQGSLLEGVFGTEFMFQGLESVGFSFEFGMGIENYQDTTSFKTLGNSMIQSAVHFYL